MRTKKKEKKTSKIVKLDDAVKNLPDDLKSELESRKELNKLQHLKTAVVVPFYDPAKETLYYRESPANWGLVFAKPERAKYIARIHHAIESSKTWGEFKMKLPLKEYDAVFLMFDFEYGEWPNISTPFNSEDVPGYCDGDYPYWLQAEMDRCLPDEILEKYAELTETMLNGDYYHIDADQEEDICRELRTSGFNVIKREDLYFY